MPEPTYEDGTTKHHLSDHDKALAMAVLRLAGKQNDDPQQIQYEYSKCVEFMQKWWEEQKP
jgi:hypothetical protein